ncbi:MAG: 16S rRNA (cytosine(1402)-N(4))-methyltransferase [endosymbiont of Galathealinum brachiosum]|uniref:Ribosomal RNA small subunit methyltransferase H n=1 Tax=endosymbiont of Galathealinum brachiosum TaxID=2200906 RepID=A0A370DAX3_9GAMM|nr:MAG: 16S rRNA (cytosine(1402)-N(4))-methyltransferase [endosymbiont of Galathealinum brachiosum]
MEELHGQHRPVLLSEAVEALAIKQDGFYLDGTFGRGGHSAEILKKLGKTGKLLAMDQDPLAIEVAELKFADDLRFEIVRNNFESLEEVVSSHGMAQRVDGVLLDIGVSSPQLDDATRGFSFIKPGPLDMRMNPHVGQSAAEWLATVEEYDLTTVLMHFGEEKFARRIANAIVETRKETVIDDTVQLANIIEAAIPVKPKNKHPATKSFQAIRIHINRELEVLENALRASLNVLAVGGRLAVISFHSLEDRMVKRFFRKMSRGPQIPKDIPVLAKDLEQPYRLIGKAIKPGKKEVQENPRSRSSVLRVIERVK